MISRIVQPHEYERTEELFCIAFEQKEGNAPYINENVKERFASYTEDGDMMAFLCSTQNTVLFDDTTVQMACVGGVSCMPHYRKGGAIKATFIKALDYAHDSGVELSGLYPFSSDYYRRLGYEYVVDKAHYKITFAAIKPYELQGHFFLNENGSELPSIKEVYAKFAKHYNFMFARNSSEYFEEFGKNRPTHDGKHTYVYKTGDNEEPKAVIQLEKVEANGGYNLQCNIFWYTCEEGLRALLTHAAGVATFHKQLELTLPIDVDMQKHITEWALYPIQKNIAPCMMMRIVNVKKALLAAKYIGSGEAVIDVQDHILKKNNGKIRIAFENGKAISCEKTDANADIEISISELTKCLLGSMCADELLHSEKAIVHNIAPLRQIFYSKPSFISNGF